MTLLEEYEKQVQLREWERYIAMLPLDRSQKVVDLGCSTGAVSRALSGRVHSVIGIDGDRELLAAAGQISPRNCEFIVGNIAEPELPDDFRCDGIWMSYVLAYMSDPGRLIREWACRLSDNGWFAIVDIDALFSSHMSKESPYYRQINAFEQQSENGPYDFRIGRKIRKLMVESGLEIVFEDNNWYDRELNFDGPADQEVLDNWRARLQRMSGLRTYLGEDYAGWAETFLEALHQNRSAKSHSVVYVIGRKSA